MMALFAACAPPLQDPWGRDLGRGTDPGDPPALPERIEADLELIPRERGSAPFNARLYAEPGRRYRIDFIAFTGSIIASWGWEGGDWILVRHDTRTVRRGRGDALELDGVRARLPDVHAVLGFLWGRPLPGVPGADPPHLEGGLLHWTHGGEPWDARIDASTGLVRRVRSPGLALRYARHRARGPLVIAEEAELFLDGESALLLRVDAWTAAPAWGRDPFGVRVPGSYE